MPPPKRTEHDLMAAAGIAEGSYSARSVELGRMRLKPANSEVDVADRSRITLLRRLPEIESSDDNPLGRQRSVDADIISPIAVVPRAAVHVDDRRKGSCASGSVDASQPRLISLALILHIPHVYF